jgi:hypothetical protein
MALQYSVTVRNAQLDQVQTQVGTAPLLRIYTGAVPATCATAASGTQIASITLPSSWMAAASAGSKALSGTWQGAGIAAGSAGYFRIYDSTGTTCHLQGTVTASGGGGDLTLDNISIANLQIVSVATFTLSAGNA